MITEQTFKCSKCGKEFRTKGNYFNQVIIDHYSHYKFYLHYIANHRDGIKPKGWLMITFETLKWIPLLVFQTIHIIHIPVFVGFFIYLILFWIKNV